MQDNPAIIALHELAAVPSPQYDPNIPFADFLRQSAPHKDKVRQMTANVFNLMETHRIPHHPKLKAQHDRGIITGQEYAQAVLNQLYGA